MPSAEKLAAIGLTQKDYQAQKRSVDVFPDNFDSVKVFEAMCTQWRMGFGGATGLDYQVLPTVLQFLNMSKRKWARIFSDVRFMESEAMRLMSDD